MASLFERMGLVRTEYEGMPEIPMQPVSEPMYTPETPVIDATHVSYDDVIASIGSAINDNLTMNRVKKARDGFEEGRLTGTRLRQNTVNQTVVKFLVDVLQNCFAVVPNSQIIQLDHRSTSTGISFGSASSPACQKRS